MLKYRKEKQKMKFKVIIGIMVTLLFIGMLTLAFDIQPAKASGTIYIRADGSVVPSTANITSLDDVTYTFTDNNYDSIVVERDNIIIDGLGYTLQGPSSENGFFLNGRSNVTIKNTIVKGWTTGIWTGYSSGNTIDNNTVTSNGWGMILALGSSNNTISGNTVTNNDNGIVTLLHSNNNTVSGNKVTLNKGIGIQASNYSCSNTISGNTVTSNGEWGIVLPVYSSENTISGNTVTSNGKDGITLFDHSSYNNITGNTVTSNELAGIVVVLHSNNNTVSCNDVTLNGGNGILAQIYSCYNIITSNKVTSNDIGIVTFAECHDNIIVSNKVSNNSWFGIAIETSSGNTLRDNNMTDNKYNFGVHSDLNRISDYVQDIDASNTVDEKPVYYWVNQRDKQVPVDAGFVVAVNSVNITVENLNLTKNIGGVWFGNTTDSTIRNVTALNTIGGIALLLSSSNTISGNTMKNNDIGIGLVGSSSNTIYHNSFINNTVQANFTTECVNIWDDSYPSGGNYWSDYDGTDLFSGSYQNETGSDGIGDTPYVIDENNLDRYPLMNSYQPVEFNATKNGETYKIAAVSNSTITNFNFSYPLQKLSFNATAPSNTTGYCSIVLPKDLITLTIVVLVNGNPLPYNMEENATHLYIYFTYSHSTSIIEIIATILGDINGDRIVDIVDVVICALAFGSELGEPKWNPIVDLNQDGIIDIVDLVILGVNYGKTW